ncbi:metallophosphoesterase family protein [Paenibacillus sp. ClWae2A]|uniref:metallophosphoesterase family protein n=1 Tax=Paenibacillus sp. ClWae2A TaxID=3057177 RepID=UPI0028F5DBA9|nr:metallophosphoesterase family protein [Paenibacillus sp. ClWae2A]MDT9718613.1 metallophosphoesterase family protein [Paenibacillus sp. ClWae2A]
MKIAIITDIHGNYPALSAVFSDIVFRGDIEHTYCLGDMIGIGPNSNEVLEEIMNRKDVSAVSGNHEEAVLKLLQGKDTLPGHEMIAEHHKWVGKQLKKENIKFIENLPQTLEVEIEGKKILITHYHMKKEEREIIDETPSGLKLDARYEGSPYTLVCFGHHHPIHYFKTDQRVYLNPGALGCNDHAIARYAVVELKKRTVNIQLIGITYDNKAFLESFEQLKVPDREFMIKAFHGNQLERDFKDGNNIS